MTKFTDLNLSPKILQAIEDVGYDTPTPIQEQAIPFALEGRDVLGIAQTGTGKTAGFTLPMIQKLARGRGRARMPRSLVLTPTRELAAQVSENFELYAKYVKLDMALLIGGVSFREQGRLLDKGVDVLIATPGRLLDHVGRGKLLLSGIEIMVVDEADRMLDMGFIPDIEKIFKLTPFTRQTLFFSATMAPEIARITKEFLQNPAKVEVKREEMTSNLITQRVCDLPTNVKRSNSPVKRSVLRALIAHESHQLTNAIVFCNRKSEVDTLLKSFKKHGISAGAIHGGLDQKHRLRVLKSFKNNEITFLLASDVAARGLDIPMVSHVFNYDIPTHPEDYIHRIGRTGRAGRSGFSFSLCAEADHKYLAAIEKLMGSRILSIELDDFGFEAEAEDKPKSRTTQRDAVAGGGGGSGAGGDKKREGAGGRRRRNRSGSKAGAGGGGGQGGNPNAKPSENRGENRGQGRNRKRGEGRGETRGENRGENRNEGRSENRNENRGEKRTEPRKETRNEGRKEGRNEGRNSNRNEGRNRRDGGQGKSKVAGMGEHIPSFLK